MVTDNYVKEEDGTGVVHQAPYFGAVRQLLFLFLFFIVFQFDILCGCNSRLFSCFHELPLLKQTNWISQSECYSKTLPEL